MALVYGLHCRFLLFSHLTVQLLLILTSKGNGHSGDCPDSFDCGNLGFFRYPFTTVEFPHCGALAIQGCDDLNKTAMKHVQFTKGGKLFQVTKIDDNLSTGNTISIIDPNITKLLEENACEAFSHANITLPPPSPFGTFFMKDYITAFKCNRIQKLVTNPPNNFFKNSTCPYYDFYFGASISDDESNRSFASCSLFHLPIIELGFSLSGNPFPFLTDEITFQFQPLDNCRLDNGKNYCSTSKRNGHSGDCPESFDCGSLGWIEYPFTTVEFPNCGALAIQGCHDLNKTAMKHVQFTKGGKLFQVMNIDNNLSGGNTISIIDQNLTKLLEKNACEAFSHVNITLPPPTPFGTFFMKNYITAFKCNRIQKLVTNPPNNFFKNSTCPHYDFYFGDSISDDESNHSFASCLSFHLPVNELGFALSDNPFPFLADKVTFQFQPSDFCQQCHYHDKNIHCRVDRNGQIYCPERKGRSSTWKLGLVLAVVVAVGVAMLILLACCIKTKTASPTFLLFRKESSTHLIIGEFLKEHGPLPAARYSYSDVKKITNSFRNKLGQGGFGSVYKGKLPDDRVVAVKVLSESKGDGEDFINEVASISRTSHVNVVRLLGFCLDGSKKALIYEFMPNGSLEKFIYEEENSLKDDRQLDCKTLYDIAIGIARGLEYLHRGCNTRILHFDIKPHNILLDEDFCPKISDFGLAKICPRKESIVSIFGARGTPGYIAPELFSRHFGGVSHKSDVYSYGMMVLEMVGRRKNIKVDVDCSSELYFPHWIYKRLELNQDLGLRCIKNEIDEEMVRKMTMVSLWCIQTDPSHRPAMNKVVEMLEGSLQMLEIPPKPFLSSPSTSSIHLSSETL